MVVNNWRSIFSLNTIKALLSKQVVKVGDFGYHSVQGKRKYMEDRVFTYGSLSEIVPMHKHSNILSEISLFGVFDGHGGHVTPEFAVEHYPKHLCSSLIHLCKCNHTNGFGEFLTSF
jgi:serine/threonine protein phosphatase PrpC